MRVLLTLAYDGSAYNGWQVQPGGITVQDELSRALSVLYKSYIRTVGAGRTDARVHARAQRACFNVTGDILIPLENLPSALNSKLPNDIVVTNAEQVPDDFSPLAAQRRTYEYLIQNVRYPDPKLVRYAGHVPEKLNTNLMDEACKHFIGEFDFAAFCASGAQVQTTVREIYNCSVVRNGDLITLTVTGNGFLYNMVRVMAGTLIDVGLGKKQPCDIISIIEGKDRNKAGKTAPPQGLTLIEVVYG
jgi:tRNA pseudouridine38-40 synthase